MYSIPGVKFALYDCLVCLFVCLSTQISQKPHSRTSPDVMYMLSVAIAQSTCNIKIVTFQSVSERQHARWTMIVKLQPSRSIFNFFSLKLWSYCTDLHQNFSQCRGISVAINRPFTKRCCILFRNARAKSEDSQFWRLQKGPKVNRLP